MILYAANVVAASAVDAAMLWVALRRGLVPATETRSPAVRALFAFFPGLVFLASIPVALVEPSAAPWVWIAMLVLGPQIVRARRH